jgi:UDP:flavonoid glycosyltransferase YjiC (YdhE family)
VLYEGVPMVLVGIGGDRPVNAYRAGELGFAISLDLKQANAEALLDAGRAALLDPEMRSQARALRDESNAMAPISDAVRIIEHVTSGAI